MKTEIKVGDTFRVFEVVKPENTVKDYKGKQFVETYKGALAYSIYAELAFAEHELKQVGTIRIKSLKDKS